MELHRRRSPRREGAGRLAAGETERLGHGLGVEPAKPADRRGGAERTQHARAVPALGAERGIIEPEPDPRRHLASGGDGDQQVAARQAVAFGDRQSGRDHFRRHMGQRRPVHVAHGHRGDEIAVENGRAGERQPVAANDAALVGLRQSPTPGRQAVASPRRGARRPRMPMYPAGHSCSDPGHLRGRSSYCSDAAKPASTSVTFPDIPSSPFASREEGRNSVLWLLWSVRGHGKWNRKPRAITVPRAHVATRGADEHCSQPGPLLFLSSWPLGWRSHPVALFRPNFGAQLCGFE